MNLVLRMSCWLVMLGCFQTAKAENPDRFRPSGSGYDGSGALQLVHPHTGGQWASYLGAAMLSSERIDTTPALRHMSGGHVGGGIALHDAIRFEFDVPFYASIAPDNGTETTRGVGDLRLGITMPLLPATARTVGIAISPYVDAATGSADGRTGEEFPGGGAIVSVGGGGEMTVGWRLNGGAFGGARGPAARLGAGLDVPLRPRARIGVEATHEQTLTNSELRVLETHLYASTHGSGATTAKAFVGTGLLPDAGSPAVRMGLLVSWSRAGLEEDPDGDGIPTSNDACPYTAEDRDGYTDRDGCPDPDRDLDDVPDAVDECPEEPEDRDGYRDRDGCPDADNDFDGLPDTVDTCPMQAGTASTAGCPDEDDDGIADREDECPAQPGPSSSFGCPDWDGDRVPNIRDACPSQPAEPTIDPRWSDGCPTAVWRGEGQILHEDPVYFAFNRASVDPRSIPTLIEIASIIRSNPDILLVEIAGHADEVGSRFYNRRLSRLRAAAVRHVLITEGGVEPDRVVAVGYGEERPIGDNTTEAGRAENRRVEFRIRRTSEAPNAPTLRSSP